MASKEIQYQPIERSSDDLRDGFLLQNYAKHHGGQRWERLIWILCILTIFINNGVWVGLYNHQKGVQATNGYSVRVPYEFSTPYVDGNLTMANQLWTDLFPFWKDVPSTYTSTGGFLHGSVDTEGIVCASIATRLDMMVVRPCPRQVHKAKHPTPHHDAWDVMDWILDHAGAFGGDLRNLVVGGISSGANLAASVTQQFFALGKGNRDVQLKGQTSPVQCSDALGLPTSRLKYLSGLLEAEDIGDPLLNPPLADDTVLCSLPKTSIIVAGGDPLRDESLLYANGLKQVGVPTKVHVFTGMPHHFIVYDLPSAKICQNRVLESIRWALADGEGEVATRKEWKVEPIS